ncbi:MAG: hypothetical protein ACYDED_06730 [Ferrimicrobium sp.]
MSLLATVGIAVEEIGVRLDTLRRREREGKIEPVEQPPTGGVYMT